MKAHWQFSSVLVGGRTSEAGVELSTWDVIAKEPAAAAPRG